ncbi:MAG: acyltransferase family protein [Aliishimia sp.]
MKYRPEIDGLRTIAVVPVILFHAGFSFVSGGFVGVDVFFVISGYLITTILLSEMDNGRYSLLRFYERRARRILPALFLVMALCIPFAWMFMLQTQLKDFFESLTTTALFTSNFLYYSESGYFAAVAEEKPLLHTWSLAVEEQYYLLFPPLLAVMMKFGRKVALAFIAMIAFVSLAYASLADLEAEAKFFLTHVRIWELLVGSLCAYAMMYHKIPSNAFLGILGLGLVAAPILLFDHGTPYPLFALVPVLGTALIILFAREDTSAARLLSLKPMVAIGLISFSAYLWHQPLFAFARITTIGVPPQWVMALLALASLGLAALTWRFVEQPFRGNPAPILPKRAPLLFTSLVGILTLTGIGWYGHEQDGFPDRVVQRSLVEPIIDARFERFRTWDVLSNIVPARFDLTRFSDDASTHKVLILGDSHSKGIFNAIYQNPDLFEDIDVRHISVPFRCYHRAEGPQDVSECHSKVLALGPELFDAATHVLFAARWHRPGRLQGMEALIPDVLVKRNIKPVIIGMTMEYTLEGPVILADIARDVRYNGSEPFPIETANTQFYDKRSPLALATHETVITTAQKLGVPFRDRQRLICDPQKPLCSGVTPDGKAVTYDYGHWTLSASRYFGRLMAEQDWLDLP